MKHLHRPSPAMVVALAALVIALTGTGYAVSRINGSSIKKNSVPGNRIKENGLGGKQINESKLGKVPLAAQSETATNADALGGDPLGAVRPTSGAAAESAVITLTGVATDVATTTINTTATSQILVDGAVELQGADADERARCAARLDGFQISFDFETTFDDIGTVNEATVAVAGAADDVPAGPHTVTLICTALSGTVVKDDAAVNVVAIPNP